MRSLRSAINYRLTVHCMLASLPCISMCVTVDQSAKCEHPLWGELSTVQSIKAADCVMRADNCDLQWSMMVECTAGT